MKHQIIRISALQTAKVMAALWFVISVPMILVMAIPMMATPNPMPPAFTGFMAAMPFLYALFGFVFVIISAAVYNWLASRMGGIEFELREKP